MAAGSGSSVCLTFDFDGMSIWIGSFKSNNPSMISRGEFATAYTPYQPEISQGTLQTVFEFQSLIAELVELPVVSASHYDGATATAEAALMAVRATRRERVLVSRAVHRHAVETTRTYVTSSTRDLVELPTLEDGTTDLAALEASLADPEVLAEPTRGMDVGAKEDVIRILKTLRDKGVAILVLSTEPETILTLADRVVVMSPRPGRVMEALDVDLPRHRVYGDTMASPVFQELTTHVRKLLRTTGEAD